MGLHLLWKAAVCALFALVLLGGLRSGQFEWRFPINPLRRRDHPVICWCNVTSVAFLAVGTLWSFVDELMRLPN
jgi:hypothetical protein